VSVRDGVRAARGILSGLFPAGHDAVKILWRT
jgi:hypothetical protein